MKKSLSLVLALVFVLGIAGTAFAANPFTDVPAKHWSYDAVSKLVKAGVVDGYDDGSFRGDKTMTRYEMAQVVAKAMAKSDKADAANKALIEKLSAEYNTELVNLGVKVAALEKKVGNIKFTGNIRPGYEFASSEGNGTIKQSKFRFQLDMNAALNDDWNFMGRYEATSTNYGDVYSPSVLLANFNGNVGFANVTFGRTAVKLGEEMASLGKGDSFDGVKATVGNKVKVTVGTSKRVEAAAVDNQQWYKYADVKYEFGKTFGMNTSYFKSTNTSFADNFKNWTVGFHYTGWDNLKLAAEYGKNTEANAKGWATKLSWKGADQNKVGSFGMSVGYRSAEDGFMPKNFSGLDQIGSVNAMNDIKGYQVGFDYTLMKNAVWKNFYFKGTDHSGNTDGKMAFSRIEFFF